MVLIYTRVSFAPQQFSSVFSLFSIGIEKHVSRRSRGSISLQFWMKNSGPLHR